MRTQRKLSTVANITYISILALTLILTSCKENNTSTKENSIEKSTTKVPKVDIHTAIINNNIKAIEQHILAGTNLNEKEPMGGSTPLITASVFGKTEIAELLINAQADLNIKNNDGSTALITASFFCRPEIVKMLIEKNADRTIKNQYGQTAYDSVSGSFDEVQSTYETLVKMLEPMGLKLDFAYLKKTRPEIAKML